jgi:gas vesicle protein
MIGIAAGAILGVLYAPDKGSVTRRKLSRIGEDLKDRFDRIRDNISDTIDNLKGESQDTGYQDMMVSETEYSGGPDVWRP